MWEGVDVTVVVSVVGRLVGFEPWISPGGTVAMAVLGRSVGLDAVEGLDATVLAGVLGRSVTTLPEGSFSPNHDSNTLICWTSRMLADI